MAYYFSIINLHKSPGDCYYELNGVSRNSDSISHGLNVKSKEKTPQKFEFFK